MLSLMQSQLESEQQILTKLKQRPPQTIQNLIVLDIIERKVAKLKEQIAYEEKRRQKSFTRSDTNISTQHAQESQCGPWHILHKCYRAVLRVFAKKTLQNKEAVKCS